MTGMVAYYPSTTPTHYGYGHVGYGQTGAIVGAIIGATVQAAALGYQAYTAQILAKQARHAEERAIARAAEVAAQQAAAAQAAAVAAQQQAQVILAQQSTAELQTGGVAAAVSSVPTWAWAAGGVGVLGVAFLVMRRKR